MEVMGTKGQEWGPQVRSRVTCLVLYKTRKTSMSLPAREGKVNLDRYKIQDVEIAQNHPGPCLLPAVKG